MLLKQASKLDLRKYYSLYGGMWNLFCRVGAILVFKFFCDVFGEGTHLATPTTKLRAGLIVIEAWFRGY